MAIHVKLKRTSLNAPVPAPIAVFLLSRKMEVPLKFCDFKELEEFISKKEISDHIQLWIERSRTVEGARKKGVKRHINDKLKYYELTYRCIHSGTRISRSTGMRPNQKTFRQQCPFEMKLRVSDNGETLNVVTYIDQHTHPHNEETFSCLPKQRKLDPSLKGMAKKKSTLKEIQQDMSKTEYYYIDNSILQESTPNTSTSFSKNIIVIDRVLSQQEKFKLITKKFQKVASLAAEASSRVFPQRLQVLEDLIEMWENDVEVSISPIDFENEISEPAEEEFLPLTLIRTEMN